MGFYEHQSSAGDLPLSDEARAASAQRAHARRRRIVVHRAARLAAMLISISLLGSMATHPLQQKLADITLPDGTRLPTISLLSSSGGGIVPAYASTDKVGITNTPDGQGYWLVQPDGGIFTHGDAGYRCSMGGQTLSKPVVAVIRTATGLGYWEVGADGGEFAFGSGCNNDATFLQNCSQAGKTLNAPIVGAAAIPTLNNDQGFWMVGGDGGIFTCGTALYYSPSVVGATTAPIVGMAASPDGLGYWLVGSDGHVYPRGDAYNCNCTSPPSQAPIVGIVPTPFNKGYWLVASDGGVFTVGDAGFYGSLGGQGYGGVTGMAPTFDERGYWLLFSNGTVVPFGDAGVWV